MSNDSVSTPSTAPHYRHFGLMARGGNLKRNRNRGSNPSRPTQAQTLARQKRIVLDRDTELLTWAQIADRHQIGEKEARESYRRFKDEIAPILGTESRPEAALRYLRMIEQTRARLLQLAESADNSSAAVGALREVMKSVFKEAELAQSFGLLPKHVESESEVEDLRWLLEQFAAVLARHPVPPAAIEEIRALARGESGGG